MAVAFTTREVRSALASALGSAGYNPVGGLLVKSFEESFAAVGISKDAFRRCWRFTWQLGLKTLSPWFREPSDFRDVSGEISQFDLHWMSSVPRSPMGAECSRPTIPQLSQMHFTELLFQTWNDAFRRFRTRAFHGLSATPLLPDLLKLTALAAYSTFIWFRRLRR
jgi:hypothetical protein